MLAILFEYFFHQPHLPAFYLKTSSLLFVEFLYIIELCVAITKKNFFPCTGEIGSKFWVHDSSERMKELCIKFGGNTFFHSVFDLGYTVYSWIEARAFISFRTLRTLAFNPDWCLNKIGIHFKSVSFIDGTILSIDKWRRSPYTAWDFCTIDSLSTSLQLEWYNSYSTCDN